MPLSTTPDETVHVCRVRDHIILEEQETDDSPCGSLSTPPRPGGSDIIFPVHYFQVTVECLEEPTDEEAKEE